MSNDPKQFDYTSLLRGNWPPANSTPNPEEVMDDMARGPVRQVSQQYATAPTQSTPAAPNPLRASTKVWVDSNGRQERICDMNQHKLLGILAMLKRAGEVHRVMKIVALLDGGDNSYQLGPEVTLESLMKSSWREHVPRQDMFLSLEADWQRRYQAQPWDTQPSDETVTSLGNQVENLIKRLSSPDKTTAVITAARANRQINI